MRRFMLNFFIGTLTIGGLSLMAACSDSVPGVGDRCTEDDSCADGLVCDDGTCKEKDDDTIGGEGICGDGVLDEDELCDTAIPAGEPGACPTDESCQADFEDPTGCVIRKVSGSECQQECAAGGAIKEDIDGDGCCIAGSNWFDDNDCTCGNGTVDDGETCDDGEENGEPNKCNFTCDGPTAATCNNGILEDGEECDEGNETETCNVDCTLARCGDGVWNSTAGEECDGGEEDSDSCNHDCTLAVCGDGYVNEAAGEVCDDGANNGQPGQCSADCKSEGSVTCGNGVIEGDEACDDGEDNGKPNKCNEQCTGQTEPICGNGVKEDAEACDDGEDNGKPNKCNEQCTGQTEPICGNGVVEEGESCDDGDDNGQANHCNEQCTGQTGSVCGNGEVESGESCDDGGESATCNANCTVAACGDKIVNETAGETCDDGNDNGKPNKCNDDCSGITDPVCGNSVVEDGEACDTGGFSATCNDDCSASTCGDGILNTVAGEECDNGDDNGSDGLCDAQCKIIESVEPAIYRVTSAHIIDPHVFINKTVIIFSTNCADVTNEGVLGYFDGGVNQMLNDSLSDTEDGNFKMSIAMLMPQPNQAPNATVPFAVELPICDENYAVCTQDPSQPEVFADATNRATSACMPASEQPGRRPTKWTGLNDPAGDANGTCFRSEAANVALELGGIPLELKDAHVAAKYDGDPAQGLVKGVLMGFMPRDVAYEAQIEVDVIGKIRLTEVLKGPNGQTCKNGATTESDQDVGPDGEAGWYIYLNFEAKRVDQWVPAP